MLKFIWILWVLMIIGESHLQSQIVHNFFGKDLMTLRENNSWVVANSIEQIYELIITKESDKAELRKYKFDHNGLPILILTSTVDTTWRISDAFNAEVEYQFIYVMEELFLRREAKQRNYQGLMKRENIFSETKYVNYFNRPHFRDATGLEMNFHFTPGGRPLEISVSNPDQAEIHYHFSYQSNRLSKVIKLEKNKEGEDRELMKAVYEYDRTNRPEWIHITKGDRELMTIGIEYDQRAFPVQKSFSKEGKVFKEVRYYFTVK